MEGLAAQAVSNMYGNGEGQTVKHYYGGSSMGKQEKKKIKKKKEK